MFLDGLRLLGIIFDILRIVVRLNGEDQSDVLAFVACVLVCNGNLACPDHINFDNDVNSGETRCRRPAKAAAERLKMVCHVPPAPPHTTKPYPDHEPRSNIIPVGHCAWIPYSSASPIQSSGLHIFTHWDLCVARSATYALEALIKHDTLANLNSIDDAPLPPRIPSPPCRLYSPIMIKRLSKG